MKIGNKSRQDEKTPSAKAEALMRLFPEKYRGYNILAGKVVLMVIMDPRLLSGKYRGKKRKLGNGSISH